MGIRKAFCAILAALICAPSFASIGAIGTAVGSIGSGTSPGFLPTGHFVNAQQPMIQVFPRPDAETASYAREHWAFWDGTHDIPYDIALGVSFGAYPYVFTLESGPPGMTIEQTTYTTFQNVQYGRILWHPQGNISSNWSGTVSVLVTDQQHNTLTISYTLSTDGTTTHFVFVSPTGSGSTCTYSAPCTVATAFGSTFAATTFPGVITYAFAGSYSAFPLYSDNDIFGSATPIFEVQTAKKPSAFIGIPGQTVTVDATSTAWGITTNANAADWYMENVQFSGYITTAVPRLVEMFGSGGAGTNARQTYDQIVWNNSGYGTGAANNESMFVGNGNTTPRQYLFITDCAENNREAGAVGNNYAFMDLYAENDALIQRNVENSPSANFDAAFYDKSDVENTSTRENYANISGANFAFAYGQNQYIVSGNDESAYNVGLNVQQASGFDTGGFTAGNFWFYRNTLSTGTGNGYFSQNANYNLEGPAQSTPTTTTGSLTGTYYAKITSLGNSGESSATNGILGGGNEKSITLSSQGAIFSWTDIAGAPGGYNVYIGTSSGGENIEFHVPAGTYSFTYTGQAGTTATPPSSSTAVVTANQVVFDSNVGQGTSAAVVTGATIGNDGLNVVAPSGLINSNGTLVNGSPYLGTRGYQIQ